MMTTWERFKREKFLVWIWSATLWGCEVHVFRGWEGEVPAWWEDRRDAPCWGIKSANVWSFKVPIDRVRKCLVWRRRISEFRNGYWPSDGRSIGWKQNQSLHISRMRTWERQYMRTGSWVFDTISFGENKRQFSRHFAKLWKLRKKRVSLKAKFAKITKC